MAYPMGESKEGCLRVDFDRRLKLEFHGSDISSDAGFLRYRELDDVCCAGVGTLSAHKMTTGRVSHQQNSPIKGQIVICRPSIGPDSLRDALRATFVGDWRSHLGNPGLG